MIEKNLHVETKVKLDRFVPRPYQLPIIEAIESKGYRHVLGILPRRAGKDITGFNICIRALLRKVCVIYYIFPTYSQGKKILWDSITNTGDKILDYIPKQLIESMNGQEMKIKLTNGSLFQIVGSDNYDCFDDQTEILTVSGWKLFKDVEGHEKVATLVDGTLEYIRPLKHISYDYNGPMYAVSTSNMDFKVTPNHRFWVRSSKGHYKFKTISDETIRHCMIPSQSDWKGHADFDETACCLGYKAEDFMAFMGIFLSEGSTFSNNKCYRITIAQTKKDVRDRIRQLLKRMGLNAVETPDRFNIENKTLYEYCALLGRQHDRYIPRPLLMLDKRYIKILFDWLILGDGHSCPAYTAYFTTSKRLADDVQELIIKLGFSGNVRIKPQKSSVIRGRIVTPTKTLYQVSPRKSAFKRLQGANSTQYIHQVNYKGKVYCVSVPSGVIKVRRNGKELWSGNSLMGTNPQGVVFSEYALQDPRAYQYIRPILTANQGWALFLSTPRGKNHLWELYNIALQSPSWFCYKLTLDDTQHIPLSEIQKEREDGIMSEDLIQQEYYTSFSLGVEGSYYSKYLAQMRVNGRIGVVPWENGIQVHSVWDIGHADSTCIIMYQICGQTVRIIDCYENNKQGLEHYVDVIKNKPYSWGKHFAPHDISVTEWGSGISRLEKARQLGLKFEYKIDKNGRARSVLPDLSIMDGIEAVRSLFSRCWIDEDRCAGLLKALENYRQEYDIKLKVYNNKPLHNWASHYADSARYLALSLPRTRDGVTKEELDNQFARAVYGTEGNLPPFFR